MDIPQNITTPQMYFELQSTIAGKGRCYLLLDKLQRVKGWEQAVTSLLEGDDVEIYVTGSNSKLMSGEIPIYLAGHYVSIPAYTLFFREYIENGIKIAHLADFLLTEYW